MHVKAAFSRSRNRVKSLDLPELIHKVVDIMSGQLWELFGEESRVDDDHLFVVSVCMCV